MRPFFLLLILLPSLAVASATDDLLAHLQGLHSISGDFQQTVQDQGGAQMQKVSGEMTVARGDRFYWHTRKPYDQLAVSDGKKVWIYDMDLEQVVVKPLNTDLGNTPALLFGGDTAAVAQAFTIDEQAHSDDRVTYRLEPRATDPLFDALEVTFKGKKPVSMRLQDALGQTTVLHFHNLRINQNPPDSRFHFEPPAGVDVIHQQ